MPGLAFLTLLAAGAVGLGLWLAFLRGRTVAVPPGWVVGLHGALGALGLALMLAAPLPAHSAVAAAQHGVAGFRRVGLGLLLIVLTIGIVILWWRRRARPSGVVVAAHAGTAIAALVILSAWFGLR